MARVWRCTIGILVEGDVTAIDAAVATFKGTLTAAGMKIHACAVDANSVNDLMPKPTTTVEVVKDPDPKPA